MGFFTRAVHAPRTLINIFRSAFGNLPCQWLKLAVGLSGLLDALTAFSNPNLQSTCRHPTGFGSQGINPQRLPLSGLLRVAGACFLSHAPAAVGGVRS